MTPFALQWKWRFLREGGHCGDLEIRDGRCSRQSCDTRYDLVTHRNKIIDEWRRERGAAYREMMGYLDEHRAWLDKLRKTWKSGVAGDDVEVAPSSITKMDTICAWYFPELSAKLDKLDQISRSYESFIMPSGIPITHVSQERYDALNEWHTEYMRADVDFRVAANKWARENLVLKPIRLAVEALRPTPAAPPPIPGSDKSRNESCEFSRATWTLVARKGLHLRS